MDMIEFFEELDFIHQIRWKSRALGYEVRIDQVGDKIHFSARLPFCGTWIHERPLPRRAFLESFKSIPRRR